MQSKLISKQTWRLIRDDQERWDAELDWEEKTRTAEPNNGAGHNPRKVIPYKGYAACKAAEVKALTTSKPTLEDEENWDEEPPLPPHETPPGTKPVLQSQENE